MTVAISMTETASTPRKPSTVLIALLLFGSGFCALLYQTVWLREFRLFFGNSTAANAAVLSIFMAGLGTGGLVFGRRVDDNPRPLRLYAQLELAISILAIISPFLLWIARTAYLATGGSESIGRPIAILVRLILAALVLGAPTFFMGGTLPAVARVIETGADSARRKLGLLYGINTLGAVLGVLVSTFYLLEHLGNRRTLWLGCVVNLAVALAAFALARSLRPAAADDNSPGETDGAPAEHASAPVWLVIVAAWLTGFVFFLMELTWYRMLTPLLGGTTFTFGLILAIALLGIGIGGVAYSWFGTRPPRLSSLALTCAMEACFLAIPFALGDRIALLTLLLRPLGAIGFAGHMIGWGQVVILMVLPAAIVTGVQFPMLIALLGQGRHRVGSHTGFAYAFNTLGAISGALAGGFGLLPLLSATGVWQLSAVLLGLLGLVAALLSVRRSGFDLGALLPATAFVLAAFFLLLARGPTAAWRQSPIGAGREEAASVTSPNGAEEWLRSKRRWITYQRDGIESCLGIESSVGIAFVINGKPDGHAVLDGSTQVMLGLLGAILQPKATRSLVVGLGTGSTAGWLAAVPAMEQVEVVELEPAVLKVAELCAPVNQNVLSNPKAHIILGDAREKLLTSREQYDLIVSEPSNPYRAGIASLYTKEYYEAAARRLKKGGLFVQWLQAYEVDAATIQSVYATLAAVFPFVETWQTNRFNLAFVASKDQIVYDFDALRQRIAEPPFREALANTWRVGDIEGLFAHHIAPNHYAKSVASFPGNEPNTDDRNAVEFGFARRVGTQTGFNISALRAAAFRRSNDYPSASRGRVDRTTVDDEYTEIDLLNGNRPEDIPFRYADEQERSDHQKRFEAAVAFIDGDPAKLLESWKAQPRQPENLSEKIMIAWAMADSGNEEAMPLIDEIALTNPIDGNFLRATLHLRRRRFAEATAALESGYASCRTNPWPTLFLLKRSFAAAADIGAQPGSDSALAVRLYRALEQPFAVKLAETDRRWALSQLGAAIDRNGFSNYTRDVIASFEPDVPWEREFLQTRRACYQALSDPRATQADLDLKKFLRAEPPPLEPRAATND